MTEEQENAPATSVARENVLLLCVHLRSLSDVEEAQAEEEIPALQEGEEKGISQAAGFVAAAIAR